MSIQDLNRVRTGRTTFPMRTVCTIATLDLCEDMTVLYTFNGDHHARKVVDIDRTDTVTIAWLSEDFGLTITSDTVQIEV